MVTGRLGKKTRTQTINSKDFLIFCFCLLYLPPWTRGSANHRTAPWPWTARAPRGSLSGLRSRRGTLYTEKGRETVSFFPSGPAPGKPHSQSCNPMVGGAEAVTEQATKTLTVGILLSDQRDCGQKRGWGWGWRTHCFFSLVSKREPNVESIQWSWETTPLAL